MEDVLNKLSAFVQLFTQIQAHSNCLTMLNSANFTDRVIFRVNSWQIHPTPKLFYTIVTCDFCKKKNSRSDNLFILFSAPQKVLVYVLDLRHFAHDRRTDRQSFWFLGVYTIWLMMVLTKTLVIVPPWGAAFCSGHNEVGGCLRIPGRNQHWRGDLGDKLHNRGDQTLVIGHPAPGCALFGAALAGANLLL